MNSMSCCPKSKHPVKSPVDLSVSAQVMTTSTCYFFLPLTLAPIRSSFLTVPVGRLFI